MAMWKGKYDALERTCREMERETMRIREIKTRINTVPALHQKSFLVCCAALCEQDAACVPSIAC